MGENACSSPPAEFRSVQSAPDKPRSFDFCFIHLDYTLVRVEEFEGRVTIRATADTFSRRRKLSFIRELAAEGFIPDGRWLSPFDGEPDSYGIRWLIDDSWVKPDEALLERNHRLERRFILPLTFARLAFMYLAVSGRIAGPALSPDRGEPKVGSYGSRWHGANSSLQKAGRKAPGLGCATHFKAISWWTLLDSNQ